MRSREGWWIAAAMLIGAVVRIAYVANLEVSKYDPWRHLALIRNLRDGAGFTLFGDQTYLFYQSPWYRMAALFPESLRTEWVAAFFSLLCVPFVYAWVRRDLDDRNAAFSAALLVAAFGPFVRYTCHVGPEAFAIALALGAVALQRRREDLPSMFVVGLLFGCALIVRMNFVFFGLLFLPLLAHPRRVVAAGLGGAIPLALAWWRNARVIGEHEFLFSWDGIAAAAGRFDWLSTLVIQKHPAVGEGLLRLHEQIMPDPEWLVRWPVTLFLVAGAICLLACRKYSWQIALGIAALYFVFLDGSGTSRFFRIWLGMFPVLLAAIAAVGTAIVTGERRTFRAIGVGVIALPLLLGAGDLIPPEQFPLELVTPPPELLEEERYLVNSAFYHPEALIWAHPGKRFLGMPLFAEEFEAFLAAYPDYRTILWHDFSVQPELRSHLTRSGWQVASRGSNAYGRQYEVWRAPGVSLERP